MRFCFAILLLAAVAPCAADTLVTRDGRKFDGLVIARDAGKVVFEVHKYGATMKLTFAAAEVESIREAPLPKEEARRPDPTPAPAADLAPSGDLAALLPEMPRLPASPPIARTEGPTFCVVPLRGKIGTDIVAPVLDKALADAASRRPTVIVLEMDSPGGLIREVEPLVQVLRKYRNQRLVLVVHHAISAAAVTGLAVPEIYMAPDSIYGAATAFKVMPDGTPADIEEKMRSVWRATARNAAEQGGHSPLLAMAMIDANYDLHIVTRDGKKSVAEGADSDMLVRKGNLLAMTASEAKACGLSGGTIDNSATLAKLLRVGRWTPVECHAPDLWDHWRKCLAIAQKEADRLDKQCCELIRQARAADPTQFQYKVHKDRRLTTESQAQWRDRADACLKSLNDAERVLDKIIAISQKFPQVIENPEAPRQTKTWIARTRQSIQDPQFSPASP